MASIRSVWHSAAFTGSGLHGKRRRGVGVAGVDADTGRVSVLELEETRGLLEAGQVAGSLTAEEITVALDELDLDAGQVDDFYHALDELQIEVVGGDQEEEPELDDETT